MQAIHENSCSDILLVSQREPDRKDSKERLVVERVKEPQSLTMSCLRAKLSYHESQTDLGNIQRLESPETGIVFTECSHFCSCVVH